MRVCRLYSSVAERQSCKLKVLGSNPSGGLLKPDVFKVPMSGIFTNLCCACVWQGGPQVVHRGCPGGAQAVPRWPRWCTSIGTKMVPWWCPGVSIATISTPFLLSVIQLIIRCLCINVCTGGAQVPISQFPEIQSVENSEIRKSGSVSYPM